MNSAPSESLFFKAPGAPTQNFIFLSAALALPNWLRDPCCTRGGIQHLIKKIFILGPQMPLCLLFDEFDSQPRVIPDLDKALFDDGVG